MDNNFDSLLYKLNYIECFLIASLTANKFITSLVRLFLQRETVTLSNSNSNSPNISFRPGPHHAGEI